MKEEVKKLIHKGIDTVIYEGGWWMKRRDYDYINGVNDWGIQNKNFIGLDRHEDTRQITYFLLP